MRPLQELDSSLWVLVGCTRVLSVDDAGEFTGIWGSEIFPKLREKMAEERFAWSAS